MRPLIGRLISFLASPNGEPEYSYCCQQTNQRQQYLSAEETVKNKKRNSISSRWQNHAYDQNQVLFSVYLRHIVLLRRISDLIMGCLKISIEKSKAERKQNEEAANPLTPQLLIWNCERQNNDNDNCAD
ncbi:MAG TPA: hypothetical protein VMQ48_01180 [Candidatus Saccharimonadales bacterium]|jgi:hypothetical protein|nr:hypothetical protein [Candidatus Saccharimonadales bacterium]